MSETCIREIFYYENHYLDFFGSLKPEVQRKFNWTLQLIATVERIPEKYFRHITGSAGIYEIRVEVGSNNIQSFLFFRQGTTGDTGKRVSEKNAEDPKE